MEKIFIRSENAEYQIIRSLKQNRVKRRKYGEIFIEGIESIKQAINAEIKFTRIITCNLNQLSDWADNLIKSNNNTKVIEMTAALYKNLCDREDPSEIVVTAKVNHLNLQDIELPQKPFILIFDRPSDCGNFGSIVRSANSFKVDALFVAGHAIDIYDPKVIRSSLGSIFHSKIINIPSMDELKKWIDTQKQMKKMVIAGSDSTGCISLQNHKLEKPIALILGNEAKGMSLSLKSMCDYIVSIPISGEVNSLNVACAGSILLWEIYRNSDAI